VRGSSLRAERSNLGAGPVADGHALGVPRRRKQVAPTAWSIVSKGASTSRCAPPGRPFGVTRSCLCAELAPSWGQEPPTRFPEDPLLKFSGQDVCSLACRLSLGRREPSTTDARTAIHRDCPGRDPEERVASEDCPIVQAWREALRCAVPDKFQLDNLKFPAQYSLKGVVEASLCHCQGVRDEGQLMLCKPVQAIVHKKPRTRNSQREQQSGPHQPFQNPV